MNAPTLIVGLGGKGSSIVQRVAAMTKDENRDNIGYVVFDTDVNELAQIKRRNSEIHTIQTSTNLSVGEYLYRDEHAASSWFPVNAILNSKMLTEGAGQVRSISRMAFETAIKAGKMEELHAAIEDLYRLDGSSYEQALRVIIVSTLAGGTGSGLILPVALYIRHFLKTRYHQSGNITRGFFLLPEVLYGNIKGQAERNNLKSNAYATLRELDAFLMKGDNTLDEKYKKSVKIEFPVAGSDEYEEYDVRPFDFCFLFDAQNCSGKKLDSPEAYYDHAASCIYAQSIGPMNKRSNSSEDNTIRRLCAARGRNRYAGAGTSILKYPVNDVKKYIALSWAQSSISDMWLTYDRQYLEMDRQSKARRQKGEMVVLLDKEKSYITNVLNDADKKKPFARAIVNACSTFDEKGRLITKEEAKAWNKYIIALMEKIDGGFSDGESLEMELSSIRETIQGYERGPGSSSDDDARVDFENLEYELIGYKQLVDKYVEESAQYAAAAIFRAEENIIAAAAEDLPYRLETYLKDDEKHFMHPNAVRFFLYNAQEKMRQNLRAFNEEISMKTEALKNFENAVNNRTEEERKIDPINNLTRQWHGAYKQKLDDYNSYLGTCDEWMKLAIKIKVFEEGLKYIDKINASFSSFYDIFNAKVDGISEEIKELEGKYANRKGSAARYICASKKCLNSMLASMPFTGTGIEIDPELASTIYKKVYDYAMMENQPKGDKYFTSIFDEDIINFFTDQLMKSHGSSVDLDIISAIKLEAKIEAELIEEKDILYYVKSAFDDAKVLAAPFIESPLGEEAHPIPACTYNSELIKKDHSAMTVLLKSELESFGGEDDPDVPKNIIIFYKSFYGLRANDLSKFAPPEKAATYKRNGGEYYTAYFELVNNIHPCPEKSLAISPHIDRWWHNVCMLPDLDDDNQTRQENEIYAALFWGLLNEYILLNKSLKNGKFVYTVFKDALDLKQDNMAFEDIVVSNGTPCDTLYEVWDALAIYPNLVSKILEQKDKKIASNLEHKISLENSDIMRKIANFKVEEYPLVINQQAVSRSVFELPFLIEHSMTPDTYDENKIVNILKAELVEIEKCVEKFCSKNEFDEKVGTIVYQQFEKMLTDLTAADECEKESDRIKMDTTSLVFKSICESIKKCLEVHGCADLAEKANELVIKAGEATK